MLNKGVAQVHLLVLDLVEGEYLIVDVHVVVPSQQHRAVRPTAEQAWIPLEHILVGNQVCHRWHLNLDLIKELLEFKDGARLNVDLLVLALNQCVEASKFSLAQQLVRLENIRRVHLFFQSQHLFLDVCPVSRNVRHDDLLVQLMDAFEPAFFKSENIIPNGSQHFLEVVESVKHLGCAAQVLLLAQEAIEVGSLCIFGFH